MVRIHNEVVQRLERMPSSQEYSAAKEKKKKKPDFFRPTQR